MKSYHDRQQYYGANKEDPEEAETGSTNLSALHGRSGFYEKNTAVQHWRNVANALLLLRVQPTLTSKTPSVLLPKDFALRDTNMDKNRKRNEGAYIMDCSYSDMEKLLNRSRTLAD